MAASAVKRAILRKMLDHPLWVGPDREYRVTPGGREMLFVSFVAERWLQSAPGGPLPLEEDDEEGAVAALVDGWCLTVVHALAREPLTLPALHDAVGSVEWDELRRCLEAMQETGQVEARPNGGDGALYYVTDWLRAAIAPLAASARLERRNPKEGMVPIDSLDVEASFLLTLPLLELPADLSGSCRLSVELDDGEPSEAGVTAHIDDGRVTVCAVRLDEETDAWASASAGEWLDTVIEPDAKRVRTGGDRLLACVLLEALHRILFGIPVKAGDGRE